MSQKNFRILIVDDLIGIHEDFKKILTPEYLSLKRLDELNDVLIGKKHVENEGLPPFKLDFATQSDEAVNLVNLSVEQKKPFAVAFVDVQMPPGEDGMETIAKMWKLDPQIQVVVCTAYSKYNWVNFRERFGDTDQLLLLKKPFDKQEVVQLACTLVKRWNLSQEINQKLARLNDGNFSIIKASEFYSGTAKEGEGTNSLKDAAKALTALNEKLKNLKL